MMGNNNIGANVLCETCSEIIYPCVWMLWASFSNDRCNNIQENFVDVIIGSWNIYLYLRILCTSSSNNG